MYKLIALLLLIPVLGFTQKPDKGQIYLTFNNQITTKKSDFKCVLNKKISKSYVLTYDCYDAHNKPVKQLNRRPRLDYALRSAATDPYVKPTADLSNGYLIGDMKDGKPYNGFFISPNTGVWLMFDFYFNGQRIWQFYNDMVETMRVKDTQTNYTILSKRNIFIKGKLQSGIEITPIEMNNAGANIIRYVNDYKSTRFMLMLLAENFGDFIDITPTTNGYLLESMERNSIRITYKPNGRKIEIFNVAGKPMQVISMVQYPKEKQTAVQKKENYSYFEKDNKQYVEQELSHLNLRKVSKENREEYSPILEKLAYSLYTDVPLETATLQKFVDGLSH